MGWSIGYDEHWQRDIGYGVPAVCDHPNCNERIDRGLAYVCGNEPYGGDQGCGLYFCRAHQVGPKQRCERCHKRRKHFAPKPDVSEWMRWKLTDESWQRWRKENPDEVAALVAAMNTTSDGGNQPRRGLRGDPVVSRTSGDGTRDKGFS